MIEEGGQRVGSVAPRASRSHPQGKRAAVQPTSGIASAARRRAALSNAHGNGNAKRQAFAKRAGRLRMRDGPERRNVFER